MFNKRTFLSNQELVAAKESPLLVRRMRDEIQVEPKEQEAISTICPHFGGPLQIDFASGSAYCPWHSWTFSIQTGRCTNRAINCRLKRYTVEREEDGAWLNASDE
jgi:nitrite reductase/ring-hydroxylating ferredoxin subunit